MANHGILIQSNVASKNIDSLNRRAKSALDLDNGNVVALNGVSVVYGEGLVWNAIAPASALPAGLWMVSEPEVVMTAGYKGLDPDPRHFYNVAGTILTINKTRKNDLVRLTDENFSNASSVGTFVNVTSGSAILAFAAISTAATIGYVVDVEPLSIAMGTPGNSRVNTYKIEIIAE